MSKDTITVSMNVNDIPIVVEALEKANEEIERLNNIIKEVREYIEKEYIYIHHETYNKLLEILDKGE